MALRVRDRNGILGMGPCYMAAWIIWIVPGSGWAANS